MAALLRVLLLLFIFSDSLGSIHSLGVGINYGLLTNSSLPSPSVVSSHLQSLNITQVKLYPNPTVLSAFANTRVEIVIRVESEYIQRMTDPNEAQKWIEQHVQPYIPQTKIKGIMFDEEVFTVSDTEPTSHLLPAMRAISGALRNLGLNEEIFVTTVHSTLDILNNTFPPSVSTFSNNVENMQNMLDFLEQTQSPFSINTFPFFEAGQGRVSLEYALFQSNPGFIDPNTNLHYDNKLFEQIDSVYSAIKALGYTNIRVMVSETGWPSKGYPLDVGATPENAGLYIGNLLGRIQQNQGTPARPDLPVDVYVSKLFDEDSISYRNYGLYHPDGTPVYSLGLRGYLPRMDYSASQKNLNIISMVGRIVKPPVIYVGSFEVAGEAVLESGSALKPFHDIRITHLDFSYDLI